MYSLRLELPAGQDEVLQTATIKGGWCKYAVHFRCPSCLGKLNPQEMMLSCTGCGHQWPVIGDLPWFALEDRHYHADVPEPAMRQLIEGTMTLGWYPAFRRLLHSLPQPKSEVIAHNVLDPGRAMGLSLLPLQENSYVLDIGCGWGTLSVPLAESAALVVAMDLAALRARFTQLRAYQEGLHNLVVIGGGDTDYLPLQSDFFDAAILNGVLEWTASSRPGNPQHIYTEYLQETWRVLKPGGWLYIGIENRLSYLYLLGNPEDHIELPYIALMPRWLADRYAMWKKGFQYRTHTYTLSGYGKLLRACGFEHPKFYHPLFSYRMPLKIVGVKDRQSLDYLLSQSRWRGLKRSLTRFFIKSGFLSYLAHSYIIVARKPGR